VLRAVLRAVPVSWAPKQRLEALLASADVRPQLLTGTVPGEGGNALAWSTRELTDARARELLLATFQEIEAITDKGGPFMRTILQETGNVGYVLAGSMLSLIDGLTAPKGPFFNIPRLDVGPIEPAIMEPWIEEQMRSHGVAPVVGVGPHIIALAGPSTVVRAIQALRDQTLLAAQNPTRIADPYFAAWVRTRTTPPLPTHS